MPIAHQVHHHPERLLACRMIVGNIHYRPSIQRFSRASATCLTCRQGRERRRDAVRHRRVGEHDEYDSTP
jgi:hypothetical protein